MQPDKKTLRQQLRRQRSALSPNQQARLSQQAVQHLLRHPRVRSARLIAFYWPVRGEINPLLLRKLGNSKQRFYLPIIQKPATPLKFVRWDKHTHFKPNSFRIPEPWPRYRHALAATAFDLVIMPLVAFDQTGTRLGMGGGFYDRTFAFKQQRSYRRPLLVGFAYQFQQVSQLERANWDIALDAVVTEDGWQWF